MVVYSFQSDFTLNSHSLSEALFPPTGGGGDRGSELLRDLSSVRCLDWQCSNVLMNLHF